MNAPGPHDIEPQPDAEPRKSERPDQAEAARAGAEPDQAGADQPEPESEKAEPDKAEPDKAGPNVAERLIRRIDSWQQRHRPAAFALAVTKKYGDDNAGQLVASLSHAAFVSLFPLLLVLVTILGLVASTNPGLRHDVISAVTKQFPLIGQDLRHNVQQLHKSSIIGLIVGLAITIWGTSGLAQSGMYTMAQIWNVRGPQRPGYLQRLGRTGLFLLVLAVGVLATTGLASLSTFGNHLLVIVIGADLLALLVNVGTFVLAFRVLTPKVVPTRQLVLGATLAGFAYTILQAAGTLVVGHFLKSGSVYGIFAIVLSLLAWIYLVLEVIVYAAEVNVVRVRRLWPRSLIQPPLTVADRSALALQPLQYQRFDTQQIDVSFTDEPDADTSERTGTDLPAGTTRRPDQYLPDGSRGRRSRA